MTTQTPRSHPRRRLRSISAVALVAGLAAVVLMAVSATPASAAAAPAARSAPDAVVQSEGEASNGGTGSGELDVAMLILMVGVGGAITVPIACQARIARERSIRRFRGQLRSADAFSFCQHPIADHRTQPGYQDPRPPGPQNRNR